MKPSDLNIPLPLKHTEDFSDQIFAFIDQYVAFIIPQIEDIYKKGFIKKDMYDKAVYDIPKSASIIKKFYSRFDYGDNNSCYEKLKQLMNFYQVYFDQKYFASELDRNSHFFRVRNGSIKEGKHKKAIFHLPFRKRHLISTERFNPPGIPCLYTSNNLLTACKECSDEHFAYPTIDDDSNNNALNAALFRNSISVFCLDLSIRDFVKLYDERYSNSKNFIIYSIVYPLISLLHCHQIFDNGESVNFKMEYMLPSYLMSWIFNQKRYGFPYFHGRTINSIKYSSVRSHDPVSNHNYAFPAEYDSKKHYCSILENTFLKNYKYCYTDKVYLEYGHSNELSDDEINHIENILKS